MKKQTILNFVSLFYGICEQHGLGSGMTHSYLALIIPGCQCWNSALHYKTVLCKLGLENASFCSKDTENNFR